MAYDDIRRDCLEKIGRRRDDSEVEKIMFGNGSKEEIKEVIRYVKRANARRKRMMSFLSC